MIEIARELIGVPFHHQGRSKAGVDCCGVLAHIFDRLCLPYLDDTEYDIIPEPDRLIKNLEAQPHLKFDLVGPVLLMSFAGQPSHIAIYGEGNIVHCYKASGKVVEQRLCEKWKKRIVARYSFVK